MALFASAAAVSVALVISQGFGGSLQARAAWLSAAIILFSSYSTIINLLIPHQFAPWSRHAGVAACYTVVSLAVAAGVRRPWDKSERSTSVLMLLSLAMLAIAAVAFAKAASSIEFGTWRSAADAQVASVLDNVPVGKASADIYLIVLDSMGREDVLKELYQADLSGVRRDLEALGFAIPTKARSPYAQTMLSLAAILNLSTVDAVAEAVGSGAQSRHPLAYLVKNNALMQLARRAGYRVLDVGSEFGATEGLGAEARSSPQGLSELQNVALRMTPLAALPLQRWSVDGHRANILRQFEALRRIARDPDERPRFVFAHILAPHPPFVFEHDGARRLLPNGPFSTGDGDKYPGTSDDYRAGYAAQVGFVVTQLKDVLSVIGRQQAGRTAAVMITGDHGPGNQLQWEDPSATNMTERMSVFSAYHFPHVEPERFYPTISPVNAGRILANTYLGASLPLLPDQSAFSTWSRPYDFLPIGPDAQD